MHCFIGGSGSTGSSILANVLNRHSKIFCGPETYLFTKHQLFENWKDHKKLILGGKLKSFPWHQYSKVDVFEQEYEWDYRKLAELIEYSNFFSEFAEEYFRYPASVSKKYHWIEKTPSNVYGFKDLVELFPNSFLIHTIRNPYDTIASLNRRGFSIYYATCLYLVNTAVGLSMRNYKQYVPVVYEELVTQPEMELRNLCNILAIKFESQMLEASSLGKREDISSWNLSENEPISSDSIGGFAKLSRFVQDEIIYTINSLRISNFYIEKYKLDIVDIESICKLMDFQHYKDDGFHNIFQLNIDKSRDHLSRIYRGYPSRYNQYPINFKI